MFLSPADANVATVKDVAGGVMAMLMAAGAGGAVVREVVVTIP